MKNIILLIGFILLTFNVVAQVPSRHNALQFRGITGLDPAIFESTNTNNASMYWNYGTQKFRVFDGATWSDFEGSMDDTVYGISWDANTDGATKNAIYDKIESLASNFVIPDTQIVYGNGTGIMSSQVFTLDDTYSIGWLHLGNEASNNPGILEIHDGYGGEATIKLHTETGWGFPVSEWVIKSPQGGNVKGGYFSILADSTPVFDIDPTTLAPFITSASITDIYGLNDKAITTREWVEDYVANNGDGTGTDDQTASEVNITDTGAYYTGTEVETALQEIGADIATINEANTGTNTGDQDLSLSGNTLSLTGDGTTVDLSGYSTQTLSVGSLNQIPYSTGTSNFQYSSSFVYDGTKLTAFNDVLAGESSFLLGKSDLSDTFTIRTDTKGGLDDLQHVEFSTISTDIGDDRGKFIFNVDGEASSLTIDDDGIESKAGFFTGDINANSFIKTSATSDDVLLGDGSTTSLAGICSEDILMYSLSSESGVFSATTNALTDRVPYAFTINSIRISETITDTVVTTEVNILKNGVTIFTTNITIDANEKTSLTALTPYVLSTTTFADDDEITFQIVDTSNTKSEGLKVKIYVTKS